MIQVGVLQDLSGIRRSHLIEKRHASPDWPFREELCRIRADKEKDKENRLLPTLEEFSGRSSFALLQLTEVACLEPDVGR